MAFTKPRPEGNSVDILSESMQKVNLSGAEDNKCLSSARSIGEAEALLIPRQDLQRVLLKSRSTLKIPETGILLLPTKGGEYFQWRNLDIRRPARSISLLDDSDEESTDELPNVNFSVTAVSVQNKASEHILNDNPRAQEKKAESFATLSYTPGRNYLGMLNLVGCFPHAVERFFRAKLDTASDINLIPARILKRLQIAGGVVEDCLLEIETVSGWIRAWKRTRLSFVIDGRADRYSAWFYILDEGMRNSDVILGHKFINKYRLYPKDGILSEVMAAQSAAMDGRQDA